MTAMSRFDKELVTGFDPKKDNPNPQWANIKNQYLISPIYGGNGRVLIMEDPFKSRFDCTGCGGKGHTEEICPECNGERTIKRVIKKTLVKGKWEEECSIEACAACAPANDPTNAVNRSYGYKLCPQCNGKQGTIIIPEEGQKNTTTGTVLAVSDRDILEVKPNDKVMFTNYTGSPFKFLDIDLRICIERDLLGKVKQLKKVTDGLNEGNFADLQNIGVPENR